MSTLDPTRLFRLPWNLADNSISWLEITQACNIYCDGCYRENIPGQHKSLSEIRHDLDVFSSLRRADGISIAGGDPLVHPDIVEIVRDIHDRGLKAIINTNGSALTPELLHELKKAGVFGFTFHIDSHQKRPHWKDKTELELNELRLHYAEMLAREGGISCAFNSTVYEDTLQYIPAMLEWAREHIDIVHVMVFILFRQAILDQEYDYYIGDRKIDFGELTYTTREERVVDITAPVVVDEIRKTYPDFSPCAFLNGTEDPASYKWLLTTRFGNRRGILGYAGPKFMEIVQNGNHLFTGKYLAYAHPAMLKWGKLTLLLWPFDRGVRKALGAYLKSVLRNPVNLFRGVRTQSIMIIQPIDIGEDGSANMCDGCPDMTVWNDKLVWSCRLEEQLHFGQNARFVPRKLAADIQGGNGDGIEEVETISENIT